MFLASQVALLLMGIAAHAAAQSNYCSSSLCTNSKHIACNNNGAWSSKCPQGAKALSTTAANQAQILQLHNSRRNTVAAGKLANYSPATRMATMRWDDELAKLALLNVQQCEMKHDACHNTAKFRNSGQNLAFYGYSGPSGGMSTESLIQACIDMWWNEYKDANMAVINKYPSNWSGAQIGHFTAMMQEKNTAVGCAASMYVKDGFNNFLFACNYATTNFLNSPVYKAGTTASGCTKGKNPNYTALCNSAEAYSGLT